MKKKINIIVILLLTAALGVLAFGCKDHNVDGDDVRVEASTDGITLTVYEVMGYDYTSLFSITDGGADVEVLSSYLNRKELKSEPGKYTVSCTYKSGSASIVVTVVEEQIKPPADVYSLTLATESVRINADSVATYDFKALFTLKINNKTSEITDDMVTSTVKSVAGEYTFTVTAGGVTESLKVTVWEYPKVEMLACYGMKEIPENEAGEFDFTDLFSLYLKGQAERVTAAMLSGVPSILSEGSEFTVVASYTDGNGNSGNASVPVKIVASKTVAVTSKNITTYPNSAYIDLTTLFDITYGGEKVETTIDMISGDVDYTQAGENVITLTYDDNTYTAKVTVVLGVVIQYAKADTITVVRGTNQRTYAFGDDFVVTVNGARFTDIEEFIDTSAVDFSQAGTYTAKLSVPYNTKAPSATSVKFDYFEQEITYVVSNKIASVNVKNDFVTMPSDTSVYGVNQISQNVSVTLNGVPCILTLNRDSAGKIDTNIYVDIIKGVDTENKGDQRVVLDVYAHGLNEQPERVVYTVRIASNITVTAHDYALFTGGTVYARDLFEITVDGKVIDNSEAEIEGKINVFVPGIYEVTANYEGIIATSYVTVFDNSLQGTYKTPMTSIPVVEDDDDEGEDLGWGDEYYGTLSVSTAVPHAETSAATPAVPLGDLMIDGGGITVNGVAATNILGTNSNIMTFKLGTNDYTMYLDNGIAVLDPDNSIKLGFTDYRRPMVYFSSALWKIEKYITINNSSTHVLQNNAPNYSIDCFRIVPKGDNTAPAMWFGLKVHLVQKSSADTIYKVTWGEIEFAEDFLNAADYLNLSSSCIFNEETYEFTMETRVFGKVKKFDSKKLYANMEFRGTVDGKAAVLRVDGSEMYTLQADGKILINSFGSESDFSNEMVNGGADYETGTVRLNSFGSRSGNSDDGIFSYRFKLDTETKTFTLDERDKLYGRYETADGKMYVFLDGYGQGCMSFDTSSYSRIDFTYTISGNEVKLRFGWTLPTFAYGDGISFFVSSTLNVLSVKESVGVPFGTTFTMRSELISDGAIVTVSDTQITAVNMADQVRAAINITDKNGVWTDDQKKTAVVTKFVGNKSGICLVTVNVSVDGQTVELPYAFQVFENKFSSNTVIKNYGNGTIFTGNSLSMDTYGRVNLTVGSTLFIGAVTYADGNGFTVKLHNAAGEYLCGVGEILTDGIIKFTATGSAPFSDYFTTGSSRVIGKTGIGIDGLVLREFTVSGKKTYFVSSGATSVGETASVEVVSGSDQLTVGTVIRITCGDTVKQATIGEWNNTVDGLTNITAQ